MKGRPATEYGLMFGIGIVVLFIGIAVWFFVDLRMMDIGDAARNASSSAAASPTPSLPVPPGMPTPPSVPAPEPAPAAPEAWKPPATGPLPDAEWKKILTPQQYDILRQKGTEVPFSSPLDEETRPGTYVSADCGVPLFRSEQKYDSGTGWPSFTAPISPDVVKFMEDDSIPYEPRTEVLDAKCGGHLGHVFDDGPPPTGKRYCMNGAALKFIPDDPHAPAK